MEDGSSSAGDVKRKPQPQEKLVRVFDAEQESEVMVVRGLLESQGIDTDVTSLDAQQDILPGVGGTVILVREEDAAKARQVIEEYRQAPGDEDTAEFEISEDPEPEG
jgi:Putative prokaryotic signal transducing protein